MREAFASTTVRGSGGVEPQATVSGNMQTKRPHGCRRRSRSTVSRTTVDGVVFTTRGSGVGANAPTHYFGTVLLVGTTGSPDVGDVGM